MVGRFATLDVLRGFALLGILMLNIDEFAGPETLWDMPVGGAKPAFSRLARAPGLSDCCAEMDVCRRKDAELVFHAVRGGCGVADGKD